MSEATAFGFVRRHLWRIYIPTVLFAIAESLAIPFIPVIAIGHGMGAGAAALASSALVVGQLAGNIPAPFLLRAMGERRSMISAAGLALLALALPVIASHSSLLVLGAFLLGASAAIFSLARHALVAVVVRGDYRGRALSVLGGSFRIGFLIGPVLGAAAALLLDVELVLLVLGCGFALATILMIAFAGEIDVGELVVDSSLTPEGYLATWRRHRRIFATAGLGTALVAALRASRFVLIPLVASIVLTDAWLVALVFALSGLLETMLFYLGGIVMDRVGRVWAAVPSALIMGVSLLIVALSPALPNSGWVLVFAVVGVGVGNGLSSGLLLTVSADYMPETNRQVFLGSWRLIADFGGAVVPLALSATISLGGLAAGGALLVSIGVAAGLVLGGALRKGSGAQHTDPPS